MKLVDPTHIIIHHTWSVDNKLKYDWDTIRRYHKSLGWDGIGYHYGIEEAEGKIIVQRGRPEYIVGAHCKNNKMNFTSLGIAVIGNFDWEEPNQYIISRLAGLCCVLKSKHETIKHIEPHNKYAPYKTCPGKLFNMSMLLDSIKYYETGKEKI